MQESVKEEHVRPEVLRYYDYFKGCVKKHGPESVKRALQTGRDGKLILRIMHNKKDRYQMLQLLDLI